MVSRSTNHGQDAGRIVPTSDVVSSLSAMALRQEIPRLVLVVVRIAVAVVIEVLALVGW